MRNSRVLVVAAVLLILAAVAIVSAQQPAGLTPVNGACQPGSGSACVVVSKALTGQSANIALTPLLTIPQAGAYRFTVNIIETQAATTSSTLPSAQINFTDMDSNTATNPAVALQLSTSATANALGVNGNASWTVNCKAGTVFSWGTISYASVGATPMLFAARAKLEFLGP